MKNLFRPRQQGKASLLYTLIKIQEQYMKRNIGNGKTVQSLEWEGCNKVIVSYTDLTKEAMNRKNYEQVIKTVKEPKKDRQNYEWPSDEGICQECGNELWFGQSECSYADLCDDCYYLEQINKDK